MRPMGRESPPMGWERGQGEREGRAESPLSLLESTTLTQRLTLTTIETIGNSGPRVAEDRCKVKNQMIAQIINHAA